MSNVLDSVVQILEKVFSGRKMTCPVYWSSWNGEIVDYERKKIGVRFRVEGCEKYVTCFDAWGADNTGVVKLRELCTQIFRMRVAIFGDRFFVCGSSICVTFLGQDGADF